MNRKQRKKEHDALMKIIDKNGVSEKDVIKIYPEKRNEQGFLICPFCNSSDCLRQNQHEWYCINKKEYFNFKRNLRL